MTREDNIIGPITKMYETNCSGGRGNGKVKCVYRNLTKYNTFYYNRNFDLSPIHG